MLDLSGLMIRILDIFLLLSLGAIYLVGLLAFGLACYRILFPRGLHGGHRLTRK